METNTAIQPDDSDLQKLRLHLGCGKRFISGMVHIDCLPAPHIDHVSNVQSLPFIDDDAADFIYASHILEHFGRYEYMDVLKEWHRILCPGGVLRLSVPDFAASAKIYYEEGLKDGLTGLVGLVCGGQRDAHDYHKMIFDLPLITNSLQLAGFHSVRRWDWRTVSHSHIDDYSQAYMPHMDKENGLLMSLNVEAMK